ncbi:hypothetical protein Lalb_Chr04g0252401 [Lupinus albus]|uniref:Uncharacterized protein n=1 Tax=Lupinus albus TaxID=3870 RepID=A0A6A4QQD7_LUPAL|nr:hypothetical protein Lalb_Chr04g0252401 [Lupinus albus]
MVAADSVSRKCMLEVINEVKYALSSTVSVILHIVLKNIFIIPILSFISGINDILLYNFYFKW